MLIELAPAQTGPAVADRRRWTWRSILRGLPPYLYLLPALAGLAVWVYRPLVQTVAYSFESWDLLPTSSPQPVGWANYSRVLTMPQLGSALGTTAVYLGALLVAGVAVPVVIGVLVNGVGPRARTAYRAFIFVPVLIAPVVVAAIFGFLLAPQDGLLTRALALLGVSPANWFTGPVSARAAIAMMASWRVLGVSVLIIGAGIAGIDPQYGEAARTDGATRWQSFRRLTLPLLSPTILFLVITTVLLASPTLFPLINSATGGGPAGATTDIYYLLYTYGFSNFDVGTASAAAVLFFIVFGVIAVGCVRLLDRWSFHDN